MGQTDPPPDPPLQPLAVPPLVCTTKKGEVYKRFGDVEAETLQPTLEEVISRKPDIIIETVPARERAEVAQRKKDWATVGLANGRVYIEADEYLMVPGPRFTLAARRLSEIIRGAR